VTRNKRNVLLYGVNVIIRFTIVACSCGLNRTIGVHSVNRNGQSSDLVVREEMRHCSFIEYQIFITCLCLEI
jgi:hypothetical protein